MISDGGVKDQKAVVAAAGRNEKTTGLDEMYLSTDGEGHS
jgi:hypothetical protein